MLCLLWAQTLIHLTTVRTNIKTNIFLEHLKLKWSKNCKWQKCDRNLFICLQYLRRQQCGITHREWYNYNEQTCFNNSIISYRVRSVFILLFFCSIDRFFFTIIKEKGIHIESITDKEATLIIDTQLPTLVRRTLITIQQHWKMTLHWCFYR